MSSYVRGNRELYYVDVSLVESRVVSARSTWYRPSEKTYNEIKTSVETFKSAGINLIFLETFYHGCSAFKTDISDIPYHPDLVDTYTDTENNVAAIAISIKKFFFIVIML